MNKLIYVILFLSLIFSSCKIKKQSLEHLQVQTNIKTNTLINIDSLITSKLSTSTAFIYSEDLDTAGRVKRREWRKEDKTDKEDVTQVNKEINQTITDSSKMDYQKEVVKDVQQKDIVSSVFPWWAIVLLIGVLITFIYFKFLK